MIDGIKMIFSKYSQLKLIKAALFRRSPIYVQFYVTARCNLTCKQCNIIYANSDVRECTLDEIKRIADNLVTIGVPIVLLTGGEPFVRKDLPEIIHEFESRGIHVRMQTNGLASEEQIGRAVASGGKDISISLDTLVPDKQDEINGGFPGSWHRALRAMSLFTKYLPEKQSFAALGCVLQRSNIDDIESVIRFGTEAGWFTSMVPIHVTDSSHPMNFRTFDRMLGFTAEDYPRVHKVIERVRQMRREGFMLYDSDQYLDDILRFVKGLPIEWRKKNGGLCDSPSLYFAILPNGEFAPCCDHRMSIPVATQSKEFARLYHERAFQDGVRGIVRNCPGCMFGSFPEMTITMRFAAASLQRALLFLSPPPKRRWPVTCETLLANAERFRGEGTSMTAGERAEG